MILALFHCNSVNSITLFALTIWILLFKSVFLLIREWQKTLI